MTVNSQARVMSDPHTGLRFWYSRQHHGMGRAGHFVGYIV